MAHSSRSHGQRGAWWTRCRSYKSERDWRLLHRYATNLTCHNSDFKNHYLQMRLKVATMSFPYFLTSKVKQGKVLIPWEFCNFFSLLENELIWRRMLLLISETFHRVCVISVFKMWVTISSFKGGDLSPYAILASAPHSRQKACMRLYNSRKTTVSAENCRWDIWSTAPLAGERDGAGFIENMKFCLRFSSTVCT